jgi:anti-anti-sigma regulatory factor
LNAPDPPRPPLLTVAGRVLVCDARGLGRPDLATLDVLATLALQARRRGYVFRVRDPSPDLCDLIRLAGLSGVVRCLPDRGTERSGVEAEG